MSLRAGRTPVLARPAQRDDERAIFDLVLYAQRRVLQVEWEELRAALAPSSPPAAPPAELHAPAVDLLCGQGRDRVVCFWASTAGAEGIAHLSSLIVADRWPLRETTASFLSGVKQILRDRARTQIAYVGVEPWLTAVLAENGFSHTGSVVTMQKADENVPDRGSALVRLHPARAADLADLLALDGRAFVPLWRMDLGTLTEQLSLSPFFVVAELEEQVVGYAYVSMTGRHGHLTRLVVDPNRHGQRIGARLLAECIDFFNRQGVYGITLNTQKDNARARRLYRWFGFAPLGHEADVWQCAL